MSARSILIFSPEDSASTSASSSSSASRSSPDSRTSRSVREPAAAGRAGQGCVDRCLDLAQSEPERLDRALQPLQQVHRHQLLQALLAAELPEVRAGVPPLTLYSSSYLSSRLGKHVGQRRVHGEGEHLQLVEDLVEASARRAGPSAARGPIPAAAARGRRRSRWCRRTPGCAVRERAIVTASSSSKKSKSSICRIALGGALLGGQLGPVVERPAARRRTPSRRVVEMFELLLEVLRVALVGQLQLVLQVVEAVVHRGGRQHQHLGLHALAG